METLDLLQGSDKWKAIRGKYLVASEAPVIMGASPHTKRDELLFLKATGEEKAIDEWVEKFVFKKGHEVEEKARPIAEACLGEDLYPVTGLAEVDGLPLLASFDGLTMLEDNHWEHKQFNKGLWMLVANGGGLLPEHYWQLEHQMLVRRGDSCVFACSDGTKANYAECVYHSVPERREQLLEGWRLFLADLEAYEPKIAKSELVGKGPMDLPALRIELKGDVTASNLDTFKQVALDVFGSINTDLQTDEDFAAAEKTIKWCESVEDKLEAAKQHALSQTASIDELFRTIDDLREEGRTVRLNLTNKVKDRKKEKKLEIAKAAKDEFDKHIETLNKALGGNYMPRIDTDFNAALKGKRTVATLASAANDEFARARIEANRVASRIEENLALMTKLAGEHEFLFADKNALVVQHEKTALEAIVKQRIAEHEAALKVEADRKAEEERRRQEEVEQANQAAQAKAEESAETKAANPEPVQPSLIGTASSTEPGARPKQRPTDDQIITAVAQRFDVPRSVALGWLMELNLRDADSFQQAAHY